MERSIAIGRSSGVIALLYWWQQCYGKVVFTRPRVYRQVAPGVYTVWELRCGWEVVVD